MNLYVFIKHIDNNLTLSRVLAAGLLYSQYKECTV